MRKRPGTYSYGKYVLMDRYVKINFSFPTSRYFQLTFPTARTTNYSPPKRATRRAFSVLSVFEKTLTQKSVFLQNTDFDRLRDTLT